MRRREPYGEKAVRTSTLVATTAATVVTSLAGSQATNAKDAHGVTRDRASRAINRHHKRFRWCGQRRTPTCRRFRYHHRHRVCSTTKNSRKNRARCLSQPLCDRPRNPKDPS